MESTFIQDTLTDNKKIFERLVAELAQAKTEILVAMAWFTDPELFDILKSKLTQGLTVSIILSEQADNEKLDFPLLENLGAEVIRVKNVGYGMMHQKFCVVDKRLAISGSYNWSINARTNNHESVIITNYEKTVTELLEVFKNIKERAIRLSAGETLDEILKSENIEPAPKISIPETKVESQSILEQTIQDFKDVLDTLIEAEVGNFDKQLLKETGYLRASENNGDHQILPQAMDSVYSSFINNIEVVEERKRKLSSKIDEQLRLSSGSLESKLAYEENRLGEDHRLKVENGKKQIVNFQSEKESIRKDIKNNEDVKIPFLKEALKKIDEKIGLAKREFVKPARNWPMLILSISLGSLLFAYIFMFYTSVVYILIFSQEDAIANAVAGNVSASLEVFDPRVFEKTFVKGYGALFFVVLFVSIPYSLGALAHLTTWPKWAKAIAGPLGILIIDFVIGIRVTQSIHEYNVLIGRVRGELSLTDSLSSGNFWLVFIFGSLGLLLFKIVLSKLFSLFEERSATVAENRNKILVEDLEKERSNQQQDINGILSENIDFATRITHLDHEIEKTNLALDNLPIQLNDSKSLLKQELEQGKERLNNLSSIYKSYIENDNLPISITALNDRINVFLEGWSKYLHDTFSMNIAERKTSEAIVEIEQWKMTKSSNIKFVD